MNRYKRRFWMLVALSFLIPVVFTIFDLWGKAMWGIIGGWEGEAYRTAGEMYQGLLWTIASVFTVFLAATYYLLRRDASEALAVLLVPNILLQFGLEDVLFYLFSGTKLIGVELPWLYGNLIPITVMSDLFTGGVITGTLVVVSAIIGVGLAFATAYLLLGYD